MTIENWTEVDWSGRVFRIVFGVYMICLLAGLYRGKRRG